MRRQQPVRIVIYFPQSETGRLELSKRVASVHADIVLTRLKALHCPKAQKLALLDAIIATAGENAARGGPAPDSIHK